MKVKKIGKRFVGSIIVLTMIVTLIGTIFASPISTLTSGAPTPEAAFTTSFNGGGGSCTITGYDASKNTSHPDVVIPSTIGGQKVTIIEDGAFYDKGLTSVEIPDGVTSIGRNVFISNQLTSVTISASVTSIGDDAFGGNQLQSVKLPSSVTTVGTYVFAGQTLNATYRLEDGKYTVEFPSDTDMNNVNLIGSDFTLDIVKKEASPTDSTKPL